MLMRVEPCMKSANPHKKALYTGIYRRSVDEELTRTKRAFPEGSVFEILKRFTTDLKYKDGLSDHRIMFYIAKLRPMAKILGSKFDNPSEDDLKDVLDTVAKNGLSPRSIEDYKQTMRKFYGWLLPKGKYAKVCGWIRIRSNSDRLKKSEDMLTEEEINELIAGCRNHRDKALVSLAFDSGCRVGELLTLRLRDVELDDMGMSLHVTGKTGERTVYVVGDSIAYIREWRQIHPHNSDGDAMLFVDLVTGEPMNYDSARVTLHKAALRAGIKKRVHLHLFRHTYATRYSEVLSESVLKAQLGWTGSSKMAQKYVHLSGQQQKNAILTVNGLEPAKKTIRHAEVRTCNRCGEKNPSTAEYCGKCWFPLTTKASLDLNKKQEEIKTSLENKGLITDQLKTLIESVPESERTGLLSAIIELAIKNRMGENNKA